MELEEPFGIGVDIGNSSIKIAVLNQKKIVYSDYKIHRNDICGTFLKMVSSIPDSIKTSVKYGSACGIFANLLFDSIENPMECLLKGVTTFFPEAASIAEIGSQNSQFISGLKTGDVKFSGNKNCSAGTGSFFEDQMARLGTKIEDYSDFVRKADSVPRLAGRCSVFAKTDIIHLQQEGEKTENILKGLAYSVVNNFKGTIVQNAPVEKPVFFAGGTSLNLGVIQAFKDVFRLSQDEFIYGNESCIVQACGAALFALEKKQQFSLEEAVKKNLKVNQPVSSGKNLLKPLKDCYPKENMHETVPLVPGEPLFLGIDVGSTSTNFVLLNQNNQIVDFQYFKTLGNTVQAVQKGFDSLQERFGKLNIVYSGVTGSGRLNISRKFNIPVVHDEITAQSTGTLFLCPDCDTIFEIGGQDAKFISCKNGMVDDFAMNKVCSAGTGSFIEDQAELLGLSAGELGMKAFDSENPCVLEQRCTVFMKTSISNQLAVGKLLEDICAGLCYAVVNNYLHKVVANKKIGNKICFQGGLAYNHGIIAAFKNYFGDKFSITPYFSVTGALGMALLAKEEAANSKKLENDTKLIELNKALFDNIRKATFGCYKGVFTPGKKTIGIPRSLMIYKLFPFAYTFFSNLGFNVKLSDETCEETVQQSQKLVREETCFPVKLMYAHIQELVDAGSDYIFMPSVYTMMHKFSNLKNNYGCMYMQTAAKFVAENLELEQKGIKLINPVLQMDMGAPHMVKSMLKIGIKLGKNPLLCQKSLLKAGMALKKAEKMQEQDGKNFLQHVSAEDKVLVLITRTYGLIDSVLNMGLPELLIERGCKVITLGNLEGHNVDIAKNYKNLYWPFSQHILSGSHIIRNTPNLYAVYLTNHGCGPDTMISPLFSEIMGDKPYLQIEVDEHYSKVGLITRIEAFLSAISKTENKIYAEQPVKTPVLEDLSDLDKNYPVFIPHYEFISGYICDELCKADFNAQVLSPSDEESLELGKTNTTSKEYVSFISLLGDVLKFEKAHPYSAQKKQLLLFQTEGSETDGFYATVIRSKLDALGRDDIVIVAPKLEQIIFADNELFESFWSVLCKTDRALKGICSSKTNSARLLLTGEPFVMLNKAASSFFTDYLDKKGYVYKFSSICEYMIFLWGDALRFKNKLDADRLKLAVCRLKKLSKDFPQIKKLRRAADSQFKLLSGANARYRYAKRKIAEPDVSAVIEMIPMYENTQTILNMNGEKQQLPCFQALFDGNYNASLYEKLEAFVHYAVK